MSEVYKKLEKVVSKEFLSDDVYMRHAYSRNGDLIFDKKLTIFYQSSYILAYIAF
ncbi:MAG: hypothetical protein ACFFAQ_05695 [Promethearchaeota archaeon]